MRRGSSGCSGVSFLGLLFLVFLVLKLAGAIGWSWWWVTSPLWLPAALSLAALIVMAVMGVSLYKIVTGVLRRQNARARARRNPDFVEAEGSEVPVSPGGNQQTLGLPPASADKADGPASRP